MDKKKIKKEYDNKIQDLIKLNKHYYEFSKPLVDDKEYDRLKKEISSEKKTEIKDNDENSLNTENLIIRIKDNLIITENVLLTDKDLNIYEIKNLYYDYKNKELLGKDIIVNKKSSLH